MVLVKVGFLCPLPMDAAENWAAWAASWESGLRQRGGAGRAADLTTGAPGSLWAGSSFRVGETQRRLT